MLRELRIENLLLIERAELRLDSGLNVITGETGAGKTVLAHSLDLLMGGKARPQIVRPGAGEAWVEGTFDLPPDLGKDLPGLAEILERLPDGETEVTLGRRVSAAGRTTAFIAGRSATAADLQLLGGQLLTFYGQHQHRQLVIASAQMELLDGFAGPAQIELREEHREAFRRHQRLQAELEELRERDGARERDLDLYRFELGEIEEAAPSSEEKVGLTEERDRLRHIESLREASAAASHGLDGDGIEGGASTAATAAAEAISRAKGVDPELDKLADRIEAIAIELDDAATELRAYATDLEADPERLAAVEDRLALIARLERKHGGDLEAVLAHAEDLRRRIRDLEGGEEREAELVGELKAAEAERAELAARLTAGRADAAKRLETAVAEELSELAMPGAELKVNLLPRPDGFGATGAEQVEFELATNPGMAPAPLRQAASGGELSRVMLALTRLGEHGDDRTLVFDEIDAGIGGHTATTVGEKLRRIGEACQVIAITHLPQVASQAGTHLRVVKEPGGETAKATVTRLEGEQVVEELRRMLGAESDDEAATRHARELAAAAPTGPRSS